VPIWIKAHLKRHIRFYASAGVGVLVWAVTGMLDLPLRIALAGDTFFGCYLISMVGMARRVTPPDMRKRAEAKDEGIILIMFITLGAIALSLGSIFMLLHAPEKPDPLHLLLSVISVPLGWTTLHTIMAFHYAHLFYARHASDPTIDAGGLSFPQSQEPGSWDFLYYSFVVGMTAQVSDVQVLGTEMRRVTLAHGVAAFFFNAVILALAVNVTLGKWR
jgi:uncharacterized membrane protein